MTATLEIWTEPVPMDTGAPEPMTIVDGSTLWVAYRAHDAAFPGWGRPGADEYLERHCEGEPFGVLRFEGVVRRELGAPNEERLHEHPLWRGGLDYYSFHRAAADAGHLRWIITFHDETLDVTAKAATASPMVFAANQLEAIERIRNRT